MAQFLDFDNEAWNDRKEGEIWKVQAEGDEVPVTVTLQWHEGGWNRIYEVHVGSVNTSERTFDERFLTKPELTGDKVLDRTPRKQSQRYSSDIPDKFLDSLPTIVRRTQRDIEGTRKAVQLLRGNRGFFQTEGGYLAQYWASEDDNTRAIVAYRLRELLAQDRVKDYRQRAFELLQNPDKPISLSTFNRLVTKGRNREARQVASKKTPNTTARKGSAR